MILNYDYWFFESVIPSEICDKILETGIVEMHNVKKEYGDQATIATTGDQRQKDSPFRSNKDTISVESLTAEGLRKKGLSSNDVYLRDSNVAFINNTWIYDIIWPFIHEANAQAGWNFEWDFTEDLQFTKYSVNQFYGWHADASPSPYRIFDPTIDKQAVDSDGNLVYDLDGNPVPEDSICVYNKNMEGKIRKLSMTLSLNDPSEYTGGNLRFDFGPHSEGRRYHTCKEIRPKGSLIVFPSHIHHQVTPVKSGTRYSLVAWSLGKPWK